MAACGSLEHIFEKPLPDNPTLLESLSSWKKLNSMKLKAMDESSSSFTEIFGELHFKETHHIHAPLEQPFPSSPIPSSISSNSSDAIPIDIIPKRDQENAIPQEKTSSNYYPSSHRRQYRNSDSFSSMNSESLSLCTEGLGFESFDDVEDLLSINDSCNNNDDIHHQEERKSFARDLNPATENHNNWNEPKRSRMSRGEFPPPISCIGRSGKPWVCFKSYRENGRFILKEVRIPTQEFLHACRENGRLKLQFIQSDDEILEENEEEEDENSEEENEDSVGKGEFDGDKSDGKNGEESIGDGSDYKGDGSRKEEAGKGEENAENVHSNDRVEEGKGGDFFYKGGDFF